MLEEEEDSYLKHLEEYPEEDTRKLWAEEEEREKIIRELEGQFEELVKKTNGEKKDENSK